MKNNPGQMSSTTAAFLSVCGLLLSGCEIIPSYESAWGNNDTPLQTPATTPYTTPANTPPSATTPQTVSSFSGTFVAGDKAADHGTEIYGFAGGMDIRCLANDDSKISGAIGGCYFISSTLINETGALTWSGNTFIASDFVSSRSGKKYMWMGWTIEKSANPLVTSNPLTLGSLSGTLRSYWVTVQ
jgi:hypothetical protein